MESYNKQIILCIGFLCFSVGKLPLLCGQFSIETELQGEALPQIDLAQANQLLKNATTLQDSAQAHYLQGVVYLFSGQNNQALESQTRSLALNKRLKNKAGIVENLNQIGYLRYKWGEFEESLGLFYQADSIAQKINYTSGHIEAQKNIAKYFHTKGEFDSSVNINLSALALARSISDTSHTVNLLKNLGDDYESKGDYLRALNTYLEAKAMTKEEAMPLEWSALSSHLGNLYLQIGNLDKAMESHQEALDIREKVDFREGVAKSLQNLGNIYFQLNQIDTAKEHFEKSLKICETISYKKGTIKCQNSLGQIYLAQEDISKARKYYQTALKMSQEINYSKGLVISHNALGHLLQQNDSLYMAKRHYTKALKIAEQDHLLYYAGDSYFGLFQIEKELGQPVEALDFLEKYNSLQNDLLDIEKQQALAELEIRYQMAQQIKENEALQRENTFNELLLKQNRRYTLLTGLSALLFLGLFISMYGRFRHRSNTNQELRKLNTQLSETNAEKDKFFAIIAHELRNPLWWFRNLTELLTNNYKTLPPERLEKALYSLDESAKNAFHLSDNLLQWARTKLNRLSWQPQYVSVQDLIHPNIELFKSIIEQKKLNLTVDVEEHEKIYVDPDQIEVVFRNLISNALKYTPEYGKIIIQSTSDDQYCCVAIQDSGIGISSEKQALLFKEDKAFTSLGISQEKGSGIGLILCKEFLDRNKGKIKVVSEKNKGTVFYIYLNKNDKVLTTNRPQMVH